MLYNETDFAVARSGNKPLSGHLNQSSLSLLCNFSLYVLLCNTVLGTSAFDLCQTAVDWP